MAEKNVGLVPDASLASAEVKAVIEGAVEGAVVGKVECAVEVEVISKSKSVFLVRSSSRN